jgi:hypothetical protein
MEKLEADNSGMFGLIGALESAGSAGSALGSMIASGLSDAQKPTAKAGAILPQIDKTFSKVWKANLPGRGTGAAPNQLAAK